MLIVRLFVDCEYGWDCAYVWVCVRIVHAKYTVVATIHHRRRHYYHLSLTIWLFIWICTKCHSASVCMYVCVSVSVLYSVHVFVCLCAHALPDLFNMFYLLFVKLIINIQSTLYTLFVSYIGWCSFFSYFCLAGNFDVCARMRARIHLISALATHLYVCVCMCVMCECMQW